MIKNGQQNFIFKYSEHEDQRLDLYLVDQLNKNNFNFSRSIIQKIIKQEMVKINQKSCSNSSFNLKNGDEVTVSINLDNNNQESEISAKEIYFEIIYEDEHLAVINKPAGLTTHPGAGNHNDTLVNGLIFRFQDQLSSISGNQRPGIVHRLDKDTSGLMIVAKNDQAHHLIAKQIQEKKVTRKYLAYIFGAIDPKSGQINKNIKRNRVNRLKMMVTKNKNDSRHAITNYKTIESYSDNFASLIECELLTGRTHQIRVHLESEKHSIIGDQTYNSCQKQLFNNNSEEYGIIKNFPRQALHSYSLEFHHPITEQLHNFQCPIPHDMQRLHVALKNL